ncbi:gliding motility-associated C-terminal domain-containing protein [Mucilaginibacter kameinonensis]|uniref:gliding motility-associated C-terminal domain-containing protein n=1 Tax=Mucilaginibacter kameinonensis TaxID=452286 RepID=UPI0013CE47C7|nr:gliding motility-associated C-terminal domain-containing protein [Mucilaginibacter kameinonensis]
MDIDDYSAQFSSFHNYQFIDIAGVSGERVFIATSAPLVLDYNAGAISKFDATVGLSDNVTGIGISNFSGGPVRTGDVVIGTSKGLANYHLDNGEFIYNNIYTGSVNVKIFESTYRKQMFQDNYGSDENPDYFPAIICSYSTVYSVALYRFVESGRKINTGFYSFPTVFSEGGDFLLNIFWGNDSGLYQQAQINGVFNHYLENIPVNKITDIYGFLNFGDPNSSNNSLTRQNLLIGTAKGFYYSASIYGQYTSEGANKLSLFHYDQLGDLAINDICVNSTASDVLNIRSGCENGVWLGTDNGVYFLKPDFADHLDPQTNVKAISFDNAGSENASEMQLCKGSNLHLKVNPYFSENNSIQWLKDGVEIAGQSGDNLSVTETGDYTAIFYNSCENVHVSTNHLKVDIIEAPVISFHYPDVINLCDQQQTTLKTTYDTRYKYRWYKDNLLTGNTGNEFNVTVSGTYKVEVSSCTNSWLTSKSVTVNLSLPTPSIASDKSTYCASDLAVLTSNLSSGAGYTINWYRNGTIMVNDKNLPEIKTALAGNYRVDVKYDSGECIKSSVEKAIQFVQTPTFSFDYDDQIDRCDGESVTLDTHGSTAYQYHWYKDGVLQPNHLPSIQVTLSGKYKVEVSNCPETSISSKEISIIFHSLPVPTIKADKNHYCEGDIAFLSTILSGNTGDFSINWYRNQTLLPEYNGLKSIHTPIAGNYSVVIQNNKGCRQVSAVIQLDFSSSPIVSITKNTQSNLCEGEVITLRASHTEGQLKWSTGDIGEEIKVQHSGIYKVILTSNSGCTAATSIDVQFNPKPVLLIPDATICEFTDETVRVTAPANFVTYTWNGQRSGNTYMIHKAGTVTLTVTDQNGCSATQNIMVNSRCADIHIPNTFTPNGDGFNDTWVISGLETDPSTRIRVFNRYGKEVYERKGPPEPWNGTFNSKRLPSGVYYYMISSKNGRQQLSGPLTIIY